MIETRQNMEDEDAAIVYSEEKRYWAIANINALESKEVIVKITKFRKREATHARLWKEYFAENPIYPWTFVADFVCVSLFSTAF